MFRGKQFSEEKSDAQKKTFNLQVRLFEGYYWVFFPAVVGGFSEKPSTFSPTLMTHSTNIHHSTRDETVFLNVLLKIARNIRFCVCCSYEIG